MTWTAVVLTLVTGLPALILGLLNWRSARETHKETLTSAPYEDLVEQLAKTQARLDEMETRDEKRRKQIFALRDRDEAMLRYIMRIQREWAIIRLNETPPPLGPLPEVPE